MYTNYDCNFQAYTLILLERKTEPFFNVDWLILDFVISQSTVCPTWKSTQDLKRWLLSWLLHKCFQTNLSSENMLRTQPMSIHACNIIMLQMFVSKNTSFEFEKSYCKMDSFRLLSCLMKMVAWALGKRAVMGQKILGEEDSTGSTYGITASLFCTNLRMLVSSL